jgi:hypothetical protein
VFFFYTCVSRASWFKVATARNTINFDIVHQKLIKKYVRHLHAETVKIDFQMYWLISENLRIVIKGPLKENINTFTWFMFSDIQTQQPLSTYLIFGCYRCDISFQVIVYYFISQEKTSILNDLSSKRNITYHSNRIKVWKEMSK